MSIKRILENAELVEEIAKRLAVPNAAADQFRVDELRLAAERVQTGQESRAPQALEAIIRRIGRPVFIIRRNKVETPTTGHWERRIGDAAQFLEPAIPAVGRIDLARAPRKWAGTGWLVAPDVVVTNRHVALLFASAAQGGFVFNVDPNGESIAASVDFKHEEGEARQCVFDVVSVLHIEPGGAAPDVALLKVRERGQDDQPQPQYIKLAQTDPAEGTVVGVIGYAARDVDRNPEDAMAAIFGGVYDVKRLHPGEVMAPTKRHLTHDCSTLGGNSGSVVLEFATGRAVGLHFAGFFEDQNFAVPASKLAELLHQKRILTA